ncbi:MAG: ComF family protein [Kiritimatiellae bacterium]|nr:ComF family protein [Kiritimatiellia bacterium]
MHSVLTRVLFDIMFPRACAGCRGRPGGEFLYLCWDCLAQIKFIKFPYCLLCGNPASGILPRQYLCADCRKRRPFFDCARSAALYDGLMKEMMLDFKYRRAVWLGPDLGQLMCACLRAHFQVPEIDIIVPVPLHKSRARERTYNQSFLLAGEIARRLGKRPVEGLRRLTATKSQTHLTSAERAANVRGKFAINRLCAVQNRRVLLIDDVMTTGATVNECARVLKEAGAQEVLVLTAARG